MRKSNLQKAMEKDKGKVDPAVEVPKPDPAFIGKAGKPTGKKALPKDVGGWLRKCRPERIPDQPTPEDYTAHLVPDKVDVYEVPPTWVGPEDAPCYIGAPFLRDDEDANDVGLKVYLGDPLDPPERKKEQAVSLTLVKVGRFAEGKCGIFVRGDVYGGSDAD